MIKNSISKTLGAVLAAAGVIFSANGAYPQEYSLPIQADKTQALENNIFEPPPSAVSKNMALLGGRMRSSENFSRDNSPDPSRPRHGTLHAVKTPDLIHAHAPWTGAVSQEFSYPQDNKNTKLQDAAWAPSSGAMLAAFKAGAKNAARPLNMRLGMDPIPPGDGVEAAAILAASDFDAGLCACLQVVPRCVPRLVREQGPLAGGRLSSQSSESSGAHGAHMFAHAHDFQSKIEPLGLAAAAAHQEPILQNPQWGAEPLFPTDHHARRPSCHSAARLDALARLDKSVFHVQAQDARFAAQERFSPLLGRRAALACASSSKGQSPGDLAQSLVKEGDRLTARGSLPQALQKYRLGLEISQKSLAHRHPGNPKLQAELSRNFNRVGDALAEQNALPEALENFKKGLAIAENLARSNPGNQQYQKDLSASLANVGHVLNVQNVHPEALDTTKKSLEIDEKLARMNPGNAQWQYDLSVSFNRVGFILEGQRSIPQALEYYKKSLEIRERLTRSYPANTEWQDTLIFSYNRISRILKNQGNLSQALDYNQRSLAFTEKLARLDPSNSKLQIKLAYALDLAAAIEHDQGSLAEALATYQRSLAIRKKTPAQ